MGGLALPGGSAHRFAINRLPIQAFAIGTLNGRMGSELAVWSAIRVISASRARTSIVRKARTMVDSFGRWRADGPRAGWSTEAWSAVHYPIAWVVQPAAIAALIMARIGNVHQLSAEVHIQAPQQS